MCLGSVMCGRALYVAVGRCTELGQCTVYTSGVLRSRWRSVWYGCTMFSRVVYCV